MKCDAKGCNEIITPYDVYITREWYVHGVNLCLEHKQYLSGG